MTSTLAQHSMSCSVETLRSDGKLGETASARHKSIDSAFLVQVGASVRRRRKSMGMTQADLAEKIERSIHLVGRLERGRKWPALKTIIEVANALQTDVRSLFPVGQSGE